MHSATKYIGGHSDVVAGIAVISKERSDLSERLNYLLNASGAITEIGRASCRERV